MVSVGPYMFHNSPQQGSSWLAKSGGKASPPHKIFSLGSPVQPVSSKRRQVAGVACITVAFESANRRRNCSPSAACSRDARTTLAPHSNGRYSSSPAISNDSVVTATRTSSALRPGFSRMLVRKFTRLRCSISTPLGLPVDPDVYST